MNRVPNVYREPLGSPLRWQDDVTGVLPKAVEVFIAYGAGAGRLPTVYEVQLVREYFQHYINAPCWSDIEHEGVTLEKLRKDIRVARGVGDLNHFINNCLEIGLDPL